MQFLYAHVAGRIDKIYFTKSEEKQTHMLLSNIYCVQYFLKFRVSNDFADYPFSYVIGVFFFQKLGGIFIS